MRIVLLFIGLMWATTATADGLELSLTNNTLTDRTKDYYIGSTERLSNDVYYGYCSEFAPFLHPNRMVHIFGSVTGDDADIVDNFLDRLEPSAPGVLGQRCADTVVSLDISGGSVEAAIAIGKSLSARGFPTVILPGNQCKSACVYIFAGGSATGLFPGSILAAHFPRGAAVEDMENALETGFKYEPEDAINNIREDTQSVLNQSYTYFVTDLRKPQYFDLISRSPTQAEQFWTIDTFSEFVLLKVTPLTNEANVTSRVSALNEAYATSVCASHVIDRGQSISLLPVSYERYADDAIVAFGESPTFCFVYLQEGVNGYDTHVCSFNSGNLSSLLREHQSTPLSAWAKASGGIWWPNGAFSDPGLVKGVLEAEGISVGAVAGFFRNAMAGNVDGVALAGAFCRSVNSLSSVNYIAFGDASEFNENCPNGLGFCRMR